MSQPQHNLPPRSSPRFQAHLVARNTLKWEEQNLRADAHFKKNLSPMARQACEIVDRIRDEEMRTVWTPDVEETMATTKHEAVFPGMMFMQAKERMEGTKLWRIVRHMPKGCLLHCHIDAMADFEHLIDELLKLPGMHLSANMPLVTAEAREDAKVVFRYRNEGDADGRAIWTPAYNARNFVLLSDAADSFPNGGQAGFVSWLLSRCMLNTMDSHEQHHGINAIWEKFEKCFSVVGTMTHYEPMLRCLLRRLMRVLKDDGINWVELRYGWPLNYCRDRQEEPEKDYTHFFQVVEEEVKLFQDSEEGRGFWGVTFIWSSRRSMETQKLLEHMQHCIATKKRFPHLIAGFDLVGHEDQGRSLDSLLPELLWFTEECKKEKIQLPFFFHAGETLGDGDEVDDNLFDAILLGTRRIGHGYSLYKHPKLINMVKDRRILIESCPISNEVLRLCGSIMAHPLPALIAQGVCCSLSNDGPAILGQKSTGVSHDFWQALQGWKNLGLAGLGNLAENSVRWAAFEDEEDTAWWQDLGEIGSGTRARDNRLQEWREEWESFCAWVTEEYGN